MSVASRNTLRTVLKPYYFMTHFFAAGSWLEPETGSEACLVTRKVQCSGM